MMTTKGPALDIVGNGGGGEGLEAWKRLVLDPRPRCWKCARLFKRSASVRSALTCAGHSNTFLRDRRWFPKHRPTVQTIIHTSTRLTSKELQQMGHGVSRNSEATQESEQT